MVDYVYNQERKARASRNTDDFLMQLGSKFQSKELDFVTECYYSRCNAVLSREVPLEQCEVHAVRVTSLLHKNQSVTRMPAGESISNDNDTLSLPASKDRCILRFINRRQKGRIDEVGRRGHRSREPNANLTHELTAAGQWPRCWKREGSRSSV